MDSGKSVRRASIEDLNKILALYANCRKWLDTRQIDQWAHGYPEDQVVRKDLIEGNLHALCQSDKIKGVVVINKEMDDQYTTIEWEAESYMCIHRLAVAPEFMGQGVGLDLMRFSEDYCRSLNIESIRLDTYSQNHKNVVFYQKLGYSMKEGELFYAPLKDPFIPFELML